MRPILKGLFGIISFLLLHFEGNAQQDCSSAISVCSSSYVQSNSYVGVGSSQEIPAGSSCLDNGEVNSVWYTFSPSNSGNLEFQLNPINPNDDYDFALYNLTNDSCTGIGVGANTPVSCNYSADQGATGISIGGTGNDNGSSGPNQNSPLPVIAGETYALLVSNFTASQSGYSLDFTGSVSVADSEPALLDSISMNGLCNPNSIRLWLSQEIDCSSISGGTFDVQVTGPSAVTIASVTGSGCSDGRTNLLNVSFTNKIQVVGTYNAVVQIGGDGDSFLDGCGNQTPVGNSIAFDVEFIGPDIDIYNHLDASCGDDNGAAQTAVTNGSAPFTYSWNSSPVQTTQNASGLPPGNYRVWVTDSNGCKDKASVTIDNNSPINVNNSSFTPVTCNGDDDGTAQITPTGGQAPYVIEWQTNPIQTGSNATNLGGGNVTVIVTDNTGCEEQAIINIPQPGAINIPVAIVNPDCGVANGSATVNPTGGNGGFTYSWNTTPVQTTNTATNLLAGVYTVTVQDQNGCAATTNAVLADNFAPNATIEGRVPDCGQGVGQATAVPTSGTAPYSFEWNTTPPQTTATAANLLEGDYFVSITDGAGCVQIINVKIDSVPPPTVSTTLTPASCGQSDGQIDALVTDGLEPFTFTWSSSANITATETGLPAGNYLVQVTDSIGCTDAQSVELLELAPESEFTSTDVCDRDEMSFSSTTTSGATVWSWDFGDGNNSDQEYPAHTYASPGQYEVTLILEGGCMNDTVIQTVNVFDPPTASFIMDPQIATTRTNAQFVYNGNGGTNFLWDFGDGNISNENNPSHLFEVDGFYTISMQTTDANGCEDTTSLTIEVLLQPVVYLPNAFMPEGTSQNSRFRGYGIGITGAELSVFNRWGTLLFFSNDINEITISGWDGSYKGKPANQGVYAYKIKASFYNNTTFEKLGTVTLIR